jgi:hypothetical protein
MRICAAAVPYQSRYLKDAEKDAFHRSRKGPFAKVWVVHKTQDRLKRRHKGFQGCWQVANLISNSKCRLIDKASKDGMPSVFAMIVEAAEQHLKIVLGELVAEV